MRETQTGTNVGVFPDNFLSVTLVEFSFLNLCCKCGSERISLQSLMHLAEEIISHIRALVFLVYFKNAAPNKYDFLYFPNLLICSES